MECEEQTNLVECMKYPYECVLTGVLSDTSNDTRFCRRIGGVNQIIQGVVKVNNMECWRFNRTKLVIIRLNMTKTNTNIWADYDSQANCLVTRSAYKK
ncbi:hypothetical protein FKM82_029693 [Ascaphus truei]